ncbi:MAG TPA: ABC transporter substrate-binding protein [Acidimicrobiales bacterium]|nr:ABC transporter substrate-binding protein [Acidimicrobiales bacterium]
MSLSRPGPRAAVAAIAACLMLATVACSSSSKSTSTTGTSGGSSGGSAANCTAAAQVPSKIKSAGSMNAATDASYAPNEFIGTNGSSIEGMDIDLGNAIAKQLNLTMQWQNVKFDSIIPGIGTRYDISLSSFSVTAEREKQVCMVSYFSAGTSFYVQVGKNQDLDTLDALCGKNVAVETGTTQADDATAQSKKCTDAGKSKVNVLTFPDQNGANLALSSGRADVVMADSPVAAYAAKQSDGKFEVIGQPYGTAPYGIVLPNTSDYAGLASAVLDALKTLDSNGTYKQILTKWGVQAGAISDFAINPASS